MTTTIAAGKVVSARYTLHNTAGQVLESASADEPLIYLHGHENIVPGLERQLAGLEVGQSVKAQVPAAEAYGERAEVEPQRVPRDSFPADMPIEPGFGFAVEGEDGEALPLWIVGVDGDQVVVDVNHPLAGEDLHFDVEILAIRDATAEELAHGHPHGPTGAEGHHH